MSQLRHLDNGTPMSKEQNLTGMAPANFLVARFCEIRVPLSLQSTSPANLQAPKPMP